MKKVRSKETSRPKTGGKAHWDDQKCARRQVALGGDVAHHSSPRAWPWGFNPGGFPDLDLSFLYCPFLSLFVLFGTLLILLGFFHGDFPDWSFASLSWPISRLLLWWKAAARNSPERDSDTIRIFPQWGNPPVWKPPGPPPLKRLGQKSCRTKVPWIFRILVPNFAPNFPRIVYEFLCFVVGNGDQINVTKNPRHFSMQNSQAIRRKNPHKFSGEQTR